MTEPTLWQQLVQWQPATAAALAEHCRRLPADWPQREFNVGRVDAALALPPGATGEQYPDRAPEIAPFDEIASLDDCPACAETEAACRFHEGYAAGHHEEVRAQLDAVKARPGISLAAFLHWRADVAEAEDRGETPPVLPAAVPLPPTDPAVLRERIAALFRHKPDEERLGDATPGEIADAVLAALPAPVDRAALREIAAAALVTTRRTDYEGAADHRSHRYDARCALCTGDVDALADAVAAAVLPATTRHDTDTGATLTPAERTMLDYALDQAQEHIWARDGFTDEDQAAVDSLRRLLAEPAAELRRVADETAATECSCAVLRTGPGRHLPECPNRPAAGARQDGAQR